MRYYVVICVCWFIALAGCKPTTTEFKISMSGSSGGEQVYLEFDTARYEITLDSSGEGTVSFGQTGNGYGLVKCGHVQIPVYLDKGGKLHLSFDTKEYWKSLKFEGRFAKECNYLNESRVRIPKRADHLEEQEFIRWAGSYLDERYSFLDSLGLDSRFVQIERQRLYALYELSLCYYTMSHAYHVEGYTPSDEYIACLSGVIKEDPSLLSLQEYRDALALLVKIISTRQVDPSDPLLMVRAQLYWMDKHLKNPEVGEFFVQQLVMNYVSENGVDYFSEIESVYRQWVTSGAYERAFDELYAHWDKIARGKDVPGIEFSDVEGNVVKLTDFKGKYIYIDVWASTCPPCRKELPFLKVLEKDYAAKNICFLSVSTDKNKQAWKKVIQEQELAGHLLVPSDLGGFMASFQIRLIPRFILLDRDLKIISANMTAPSDPETKTRLSALEGI